MVVPSMFSTSCRFRFRSADAPSLTPDSPGPARFLLPPNNVSDHASKVEWARKYMKGADFGPLQEV